MARTLIEKLSDQNELNALVVDVRTSLECMEDFVRVKSSRTRLEQIVALRQAVEMFLAEMEVFM